jgi:hypothetical protein
MAIKDLILRIKGDSTSLQKETKKASGVLDGFKKVVGTIGTAVGAAFAVRAIINFGKEAIKLASKVEGIRTAFKKLDNPGLLDDLRKATRGTVTDLELMQLAVRAQNFKIPLDQLATYFQFATSRAIETGESVDYLVESIITGIGRKSVLVMDNLGISAAELQDEVKRVGDFGQAAGIIIQREIEKGGDVMDTAATKTARLQAKFANLKTEIGTKLLPVVASLASKLNDLLDKAFGGKYKTSSEFISVAMDAAKAGKGIDEVNGILIKQAGLLQADIIRWGQYQKEEEDAVKGLKRFGMSSKVFQTHTEQAKYYKDSIDAAREAITYLTNVVEKNNKTTVTGNEEVVRTYGDILNDIKNIEDSLAGMTKSGRADANIRLKGLEAEKKAWDEMGLAIGRTKDEYTKFISIGRGKETAGIITELPGQPSKVTGGTTPYIPLQDFSGYEAGKETIDGIKLSLEDYPALLEGLSAGFNELGYSIYNAFAQGENAGEDFAITMAKVAKKVVAAFIAEGIAAVVKGTLESSSLLGPLAIPIAAAAGGLAAGLFSSIIPSFAGGGIVDSPTLAMVGDNPGRKEAIIPSELWGKIGGGGGGRLYTEVSGRNLRIILDREDQFKSRT